MRLSSRLFSKEETQGRKASKEQVNTHRISDDPASASKGETEERGSGKDASAVVERR